MSRIGKKPITLPKGVTVKIDTGAVEVQGPKGKLRQATPPGILFAKDGEALVAKLEREDPTLKKFHGLARSLVANAVTGVTEGFKKELDIVGVGYRAELKGKEVHFALGYSHPVVFPIPIGIDVAAAIVALMSPAAMLVLWTLSLIFLAATSDGVETILVIGRRRVTRTTD